MNPTEEPLLCAWKEKPGWRKSVKRDGEALAGSQQRLIPCRKTAFTSQLASDHNVLALHLCINYKVQSQRVAAINTLCCYDISVNIKPEKLSPEQTGNLIDQMFGTLCSGSWVSVGS